MSPQAWAVWRAWRWGERVYIDQAQQLLDSAEAGPDQEQLRRVLACVVLGQQTSALPRDLGCWWNDRMQTDLEEGQVRCLLCGALRSYLVTWCSCFFSPGGGM